MVCSASAAAAGSTAPWADCARTENGDAAEGSRRLSSGLPVFNQSSFIGCNRLGYLCADYLASVGLVTLNNMFEAFVPRGTDPKGYAAFTVAHVSGVTHPHPVLRHVEHASRHLTWPSRTSLFVAAWRAAMVVYACPWITEESFKKVWRTCFYLFPSLPTHFPHFPSLIARM